MSRSWTADQKNVIQIRGKNLLVSAAAGAGKTAVLVERILSLINDPEDPTDIDRLLVVTFTKAAAAEMRERITDRIAEELEKDPGNHRLERQSVLIHNARICTIDSFCQFLISNYFSRIGIEPGFRIGEENEMKLLKTDVLDELLEERYAEAEEDFLAFAESYARDKDDENLKDMILGVYEASMSEIDPDVWLERAQKQYEIDENCLEENDWIGDLLEYANRVVQSSEDILKHGIEICEQNEGFEKYEEALNADLDLISALGKCRTYREYRLAFPNLVFGRMPSKTKNMDEELQTAVKNARDLVKDNLKKLQTAYFSQSEEEICAHIKGAYPAVKVLTGLAEEFSERFRAVKKEKNLLDFTDLEHYALQILLKDEEPTPVALDFARYFKEIMIDEYQDSNEVQECLLNSISKANLPAEERAYNVFCVGDVKQSIYSFRRARPELFNRKYKTYPEYCDGEEQGDAVKVELHANFRSFDSVLHDINCLCTPLMQEDLGNIAYDAAAALYPGGNWTKLSQEAGNQTEILVTEDEGTMEDGSCNEGRMIAAKIRELTDPEKGMKILSTDENGETISRPAEYQDIAILVRSLKSGDAAEIVETLKDAGIPAHSQSTSGFYKTYEIRMIVSLLQIIDNPAQDIPLAAVLKSPIFGFKAADLARISVTSRHEKQRLIETLRYFAEGNVSEEKNKDERKEECEEKCEKEYEEGIAQSELRARVNEFFARLLKYREESRYLSISELLRYIFDDLAYEEMILAMPAGHQRLANVRMLMEQAIAYEKTSYKGLYQFVRYLEQIDKYDVDLGEAQATAENLKAVTVYTMHKSKGLEFPVVFVSGLGAGFQNSESRSQVVISEKYGIGLEHIDLSKRVRYRTLLQKMILLDGKLNQYGEELRILYVAATRAKQKLIFTMQLKNTEKKLAEARNNICGQELPFPMRFGASSMAQWVLSGYSCYGEVYQPQVIAPEELLMEQAEEELKHAWRKEELLEEAEKLPEDEEKKVEQAFSFTYPYEQELAIPTKLSVSDVKLAAIRELEEKERAETLELYGEQPVATFGISEEAQEQATTESMPEQDDIYVPTFARHSEEDGATDVNPGALRGTAMHRVMECLDFAKGFSKETVHLEIEEMTAAGRLTKEQKDLISEFKIVRFGDSALAGRMKKAAERGDLFKEQPFVMSLPAEEISKEYSGDTPVLVQGIIDGYFLEDDGIILMDYKTDRLSAEDLVEHYRVQLSLYANALEKALGKPVKEKILYSFYLGEEIPVLK